MRRFTPVEGVKYVAPRPQPEGPRAGRRSSRRRCRARRCRPCCSRTCRDTFVRRNANMSQAQEIERWPAIVEGTVGRGITEAGIAINAAFGSNFEGRFSLEQRMELFERQHAAWERGGRERSRPSCSATRWAGARRTRWRSSSSRRASAGRDIRNYYLHLHDSRGLALATTYAALRVLDDRDEMFIDTTIGGVGGCPYCGNGRATGMAADRGRRGPAAGDGHRDRHRPRQAHRVRLAARGDHRATRRRARRRRPARCRRSPRTSTTRTSPSWRPTRRRGTSSSAPRSPSTRSGPWREPIPAPAVPAAS